MLSFYLASLSLIKHVAGQVVYLPGDPEPASLRRNAEHARVLAEIRRESSCQSREAARDERPALVARVRRALGLA